MESETGSRDWERGQVDRQLSNGLRKVARSPSPSSWVPHFQSGPLTTRTPTVKPAAAVAAIFCFLLKSGTSVTGATSAHRKAANI